MSVISKAAILRRKRWIQEIQNLSGNFGIDSDRIETELSCEIKKCGTGSLVDHLRLCGDIPESYGHDSSEEKLYSKYTDAILAESFRAIGLKAIVLKERADAADVEAFGKDFSLVGDAKAFRLSRTAKNQKDFKIQAMDGWKRGKPFAAVVCPINQMPTRTSQIYEQACSRDVAILSYSHLAVLVLYAAAVSSKSAESALMKVLDAVKLANPSKDAVAYWSIINKTMLCHDKRIAQHWRTEKLAASESISVSKEIALEYLASEREKIVRMSHDQAIKELLKVHKIDSRVRTIQSVCASGLLDH